MPAGEGAVQDGPLHVSLDSVPPSPSVKDTLVESIPARGWCGLEQKSPGKTHGFSQVSLVNGGRTWMSLQATTMIVVMEGCWVLRTVCA